MSRSGGFRSGGPSATIPGAGLPAGMYLTNPGAADATLALTLNRMIVAPFQVLAPVTIDALGAEVTSGGTAGAVVRLGIYNSANGIPTTVLVDAGTIDGTTPAVAFASASLTLQRGIYWFAAVAQVAVCTIRTRTGTNSLVPLNIAQAGNVVAWFVNSITGALPTFPGSATDTTHAAKMYLRGV